MGERLTDLPLTLFSGPFAAGVGCMSFVVVGNSSERMSVFENGMEIGQVEWSHDGVINTLAYPRATMAKFNAPAVVAADNT